MLVTSTSKAFGLAEFRCREADVASKLNRGGKPELRLTIGVGAHRNKHTLKSKQQHRLTSGRQQPCRLPVKRGQLLTTKGSAAKGDHPISKVAPRREKLQPGTNSLAINSHASAANQRFDGGGAVACREALHPTQHPHQLVQHRHGDRDQLR